MPEKQGPARMIQRYDPSYTFNPNTDQHGMEPDLEGPLVPTPFPTPCPPVKNLVATTGDFYGLLPLWYFQILVNKDPSLLPSSSPSNVSQHKHGRYQRQSGLACACSRFSHQILLGPCRFILPCVCVCVCTAPVMLCDPSVEPLWYWLWAETTRPFRPRACVIHSYSPGHLPCVS